MRQHSQKSRVAGFRTTPDKFMEFTKMNILEIAKECNGDLTTFGGEPLCYTFAIANLEKFTQAVIKAYVSEQVPTSSDKQPFASLQDFINKSKSIVMLDDGTIISERIGSDWAVKEAPPKRECELDINKMVDNFLSWKLPSDFYPDCGISLTRTFLHDDPFRPSGTNLFHVRQVKEMIEAMLKDAVKPKREWV